MRDILFRVVARLRAFGPGKLMLLLAAILVVLLLVQGLRYRSAGRLEKTIVQSLQPSSRDLTKRESAKELKEYDAIVQHGILGTVNKPPQKLWGVMGDNALIGASSNNAKLYKVGDALPNGEKIIKIGCGELVLEKDGKQRTEHVFQGTKAPPKPGGKPPVPSSPPRRASPATGSPPPKTLEGTSRTQEEHKR